MKVAHLSEDDIQQYVSDQSICTDQIIDHISSCEFCKVKAETYRLLFSEIQEQPKPAFDFDLTDLVLSQLANPKPKFFWDIFFVYLLAITGITSVLILIVLFREYLSVLFSGYSSLFILLFGAIAAVILVFQGLEIYRKYNRQMEALNIS